MMWLRVCLCVTGARHLHTSHGLISAFGAGISIAKDLAAANVWCASLPVSMSTAQQAMAMNHADKIGSERGQSERMGTVKRKR
jgi:hypothetical protein